MFVFIKKYTNDSYINKESIEMSKKQTATVASSESLELLNDEQIAAIIKERYDCAGGSKYSVFRDLFSRGYKVNQVFKMLQGKQFFEKLIYQHVRNEFVRYNKK